MAGGIEFPQLVELLSEEFESNRQLTAHREDVDDVAATAPAPLLLNGGDPLVAKLGQRLAQCLQINLIPFAQGARFRFQNIRRGEMGLQTTFRGHDGPGRRVGFPQQVTQNLKLPPGDFTCGIEGFIGRAFAGGVQACLAPPH